jgi:1-acyl-sn-glycerol-3-phosphate acyltransferase
MIARSWRQFRTGLAFVSFGVLGLSLGAFGVPWVHLRTRDKEERRLRVQRGAISAFRVFMRIMTGLGLIRFERDGVAERLAEPGLLVVANHPTLIDAPAILSCMESGACITKQANTSNPTMGRVIRAAGYIPNVGGQAIVEACVASLRAGRSLVLFPEGTRSPAHELGPFQRGAAHIALDADRDLVPVLVTCEPPTLMRGQKWHDVPDRPFELRLRVGDPIRVGPYREALERGESRPRVARRLTAELREFFEKGLRGVAP